MNAVDGLIFSVITGVGIAIDFLLLKRGRKRVQDWLETWFLRFSYVRWSNFGKAEAERAIEILDYHAGRRLWSWRRWRFVTIVGLSMYVAALLWVLLQYVWLTSLDGLDPWQLGNIEEVWTLVSGAALQAVDDRGTAWFAIGRVGSLLLAIFAFALSISFTRFVSKWVVRLSSSALISAVAFVLLLLLHVFLLVIWSSVMTVAIGTLPGLALAIGKGVSIDLMARNVSSLVSEVQKFLSEDPEGSILDPWEVFRPLDFNYVSAWLELKVTRPDSVMVRFWNVDAAVLLTFQALLNLIANGLRILFAFLFVGSFALRPLVHAPILRVWEAILESNKPFFTTVFAILGGLFVLGRKLTMVLG